MKKFFGAVTLAAAMMLAIVPVALAEAPDAGTEHAIQDRVRGAHLHQADESVLVAGVSVEAPDDGLEHAIQDRLRGAHLHRTG